MIFLLSLCHHLGFQESVLLHSVAFTGPLCKSKKNQVDIFSFGQVLAAFVIFILSLGHHLGFPEFHIFAFHCIYWHICQLSTNIQVDIFSFHGDMVVQIF